MIGVSQCCIRHIVKEIEVTTVEPSASECRKGSSRPGEVSDYAAEITAWLLEERNPADGPMKNQEVLARLRQKGYTGGKTAVYELTKWLRPPKVTVPKLHLILRSALFFVHPSLSSGRHCQALTSSLTVSVTSLIIEAGTCAP